MRRSLKVESDPRRVPVNRQAALIMRRAASIHRPIPESTMELREEIIRLQSEIKASRKTQADLSEEAGWLRKLLRSCRQQNEIL